MKFLGVFQLIAILASFCSNLSISVNGQQINTPCTASMISSFTPCINVITGSTNSGSSPTAGCCSSLKSLMSGGTDCLCLLFTANVPFQLPINQTLAISLPRACNMGGVPIQCKASGSPLPAPGPVLQGPTLPPPAASPFSPQASKVSATAPAAAPESEANTQVSPSSTPVISPPVVDQSEPPTKTPGMPSVLTPSASTLSYISPSSLVQIIIGILVFNSY